MAVLLLVLLLAGDPLRGRLHRSPALDHRGSCPRRLARRLHDRAAERRTLVVAEIEFGEDGPRRSVRIGGFADVEVEDFVPEGADEPTRLTGVSTSGVQDADCCVARHVRRCVGSGLSSTLSARTVTPRRSRGRAGPRRACRGQAAACALTIPVRSVSKKGSARAAFSSGAIFRRRGRLSRHWCYSSSWGEAIGRESSNGRACRFV
jgi:hypothetical protein